MGLKLQPGGQISLIRDELWTKTPKRHKIVNSVMPRSLRDTTEYLITRETTTTFRLEWPISSVSLFLIHVTEQSGASGCSGCCGKVRAQLKNTSGPSIPTGNQSRYILRLERRGVALTCVYMHQQVNKVNKTTSSKLLFRQITQK